MAALAEACRLQLYRPAHRASATQRAVRRHLHVRRQLVRTRTRAISLVRALLRGEGLRLPSGSAETVRTRLTALTLPPALQEACVPLVELLSHLDEALAGADRRVAELAAADPVVTRLMSVPGIGPVTATAFVAALDDVHRFRDAGQVTSFLGLVPREVTVALGDATLSSAARNSPKFLKARHVTAVPKLSPTNASPSGKKASCNRIL